MRSILLAGAFGLIGTLLGTRLAIGVLVRKGYGQYVRDDGPKQHLKKAGTPTMGGIAIICSVIVAYLLAHLITWELPTASGLLLLFLFAGLGFVGFLDDWIKISRARSLGLNSVAKLVGQTLVAVLFSVGALYLPRDDRGLTPGSQHVSFLRDLQWLELPMIAAIVWMVFIIAAMSNGANLTDGLDGLATGAATMVFAAYALINVWQYSKSCAWGDSGPQCYEVRSPHDLAMISLALAGACFGFLWWNAAPAKIFMGDTGSLAIGGALAGLAILTRTELLLVLLGGLFVVITLSVMLQVGYFKITRGKRLFKMAPLQHHFEMKGWDEVTIVMRFWIICGICVAAGVGIFYGEWVIGQ